ncbi:tail fiber protein [Tardiphaga sp. P9-11]|uniref:tail fiber protein n=1 Tax=Tardiphaga sp. P9-11 TaxID=2024614 RepID=UPI0011F1D14E|nr:tail fiber protein [Tardiphaga sp. P9-11]KAA0076117.1 hypothetical protein CIW50_07600 [Tardiphaga sp. P9-11]
MPRATPYDRQISFALLSAQNPRDPISGIPLDAEFNAVKLSLDETQQNIRLIQDDDGVLKRGSVGRAQLDSSISIGFAAPSSWQASTTYDADVSTVFYASKFYICTTTHVSGVVFDASNWELIADFTVAAIIDDGSITSAKLANGAVAADKIADGSISNSKIASGAVSTSKIADNTVTLAKLYSTLPVEIANLILPAGLGPLPWSLPDLPAGWDWADGGVLLSDTPFASLRAAYISAGFPHGQDGSGNPKKPDTRGRFVAGVDGGANRLTTAGSGVDGATLGASGGTENLTLDRAQLPNATLTVNASGSASVLSTTNQVVTGIIGTYARGNDNPFDALLPGSGHQGQITSIGTATVTGTTSSLNGGVTQQALRNVPPTLVCKMIVKAH